MRSRIGIALVVATAAWLTGPLPTAAQAAPSGSAPTAIRVVPGSVAENRPAGTTVGRVVVRDPDGGDRHSLTLLRGRGAFRLDGDRIVTTRQLDHETRPAIPVRLRATDAAGRRVVRTLTIRVADRDDAPTAVDDTARAIEDGSHRTIDLLANDEDVDGGTRRIASVDQPADGTVRVTANGTRVTYAPAPDHCGTDEFGYTLRPGGSSARVVVSVACRQDRPVAVDDLVTGVEDVLLRLPVAGPDSPAANDTDVDGDPLTVMAVSDAKGGEAGLDGDGIWFRPTRDSCGVRAGSFEYTVGDGRGGRARATVRATLACVDDVSSVSPDSVTVAEDSTATAIDVLANDERGDGAPLSVTAVTQPANGTAVVTGGGTGLSYTPDADYCGTDPFTYTATGGRTTSVTVTVTCVPDAPVAVDQAFAAIGNTSLVIDDPTDAAPDPVGLQKTVAFDLLASASDPDAGDVLSVAPVADQVTTGGGRVTIEADGDISYLPEAGCGATTDSFDYTVTDGTATADAVVTVTLSDCVWYVDAAAPAAGAEGTSQAPYPGFGLLEGSASDPDRPADRIFVAPGDYYTGLELEDDQQLLTARSGLTVGSTELLVADPSRARTTLWATLVLATDNTVQGLDLGNVPSYALTGRSVGSFTMNTETSGNVINDQGGGISIQGSGNVLDVEIQDYVTRNGGSLELTGASGSLTIHNGLMSSLGTGAISLSDSPLDLTIGADVEGEVLLRSVGSTGGTKDFDGFLTGDTIELLGNAGTTFRFDGGLDLTPSTGSGIFAVDGATIAVTDPSGPDANTIDAVDSSPVWLADTAIHPDGLTFERISATGASSGIHLENTGSAGGLTVTGTAGGTCVDAADDCAGGTIENSLTNGVQLEDVGGEVSLAQMLVQDNADIGISMIGSSGLLLDEMLVADNGRIGLAQGTLAGASDLTVTDTTFSGHSEAAVWIATRFTGTADVGLDRVRMTSNPGAGLVVTADEDSELDLTVRDTTVDDPLDVSDPDLAQVNLEVAGSSTTRALFDGLTLVDSNDSGLYATAFEDAALDTTIRSSTVRDPAVSGIWVRSGAFTEPRVLIDSTTVRGYDQRGVVLDHGNVIGPGDTPGQADWTITRSRLFDPGSGTPAGLVVALGGTGAAGTACADIGGPGVENDLGDAGRPGVEDVLVPVLPGTSLTLRGLAVDVPTTVAARNSGSPQVTRTGAGTVSGTVGACAQPQLPAP